MVYLLNEWNVLSNLVIVGGVVTIFVVVCGVVYFCIALDKDRPVFPWSSRSRVEKAKADAVVAEQRLRVQAIEMQEMALHAKRDQLVKAIQDGDPITGELLKIPKAQLGDGRDYT